jgi:hypothetical protein
MATGVTHPWTARMGTRSPEGLAIPGARLLVITGHGHDATSTTAYERHLVDLVVGALDASLSGSTPGP